MKTKVILFISFVMLTVACKHTKSAEKSTTANEPVKYRVIVSFFSRGDGTGSQTIAKLESYMISFGQKEKVTITYDRVPWGREGEFDCCFALKELSKSKQDEFVKGLANVTKGSTNTNIIENSTCNHKK